MCYLRNTEFPLQKATMFKYLSMRSIRIEWIELAVLFVFASARMLASQSQREQ